MSTSPSRASSNSPNPEKHSSEPEPKGRADPLASLTPAAVGYILVSYVLVSNLDASAKWLGLLLPVLQIVWVRMLCHGVFGLILAKAWKHPRDYIPVHPVQQFLRGILLLGATIFNFSAIQYLQLAQASAIFFLSPFLVTMMAGPFLGEWAGPRRWLAIAIGFIGALIIIQPGTSSFHPAMLLSLGASASYSIYLIITRRLAYIETAQSMTIIPALVGAMILAPVGIWVWEPVPSVWVWIILLSTGLWGYAGHFFVVKAHQQSPATALAPFHYTQLLSMVALGYILFNDIPDLATLIGSAVIIASGLYLWWRESVADQDEDQI